MLISPKTAIENGWITHPDCNDLKDWNDRKFISPNAIDFPMDSVYEFVDNENDNLFFSETEKCLRSVTPLTPINLGGTEYLPIPGHTMVDVSSKMYVKLPTSVAALLIVRSTLNRSGLFVTSGLYDSGFFGNIGIMLHNRGPVAYISPGTRIGQIMFISSEDSGIMYAGGYNTEINTHWSDKSCPKI